MSQVSDLLAQSLALHAQAFPQNRDGRPSDWLDKLKEAARLRRQAHQLDPKHADPAWEAEQGRTPVGYDTHALMTQFYAEQERLGPRPKRAKPLPTRGNPNA